MGNLSIQDPGAKAAALAAQLRSTADVYSKDESDTALDLKLDISGLDSAVAGRPLAVPGTSPLVGVVGGSIRQIEQYELPMVRGVTMFDAMFVSYEVRSDYRYRQTSSTYPPDSSATFPAGVSPPTFMAHMVYQNAAWVEEQIAAAAAIGVNLLRIAVEPAMQYQTQTYIIDSVIYPTDMDALDTIIGIAQKYDVVVQLQNGNDRTSSSLNNTFLTFLATRYKDRPNVWINPKNEPNSLNNVPPGAGDDPAFWYGEMPQYLVAIRATGFLNPIVLNVPHYSQWIDQVETYLDSDPVFTGDPNLIIGPHLYPAGTSSDWSTLKTYHFRAWSKFTKKYCLVIDESGMTPDPATDVVDTGIPGQTPSSDGNILRRHNTLIDMLQWLRKLEKSIAINGAILFCWYWPNVDATVLSANTMRLEDGTFTNWGNIAKTYYLSPQEEKNLDYAGTGDCNYLINAKMEINQRAFAGGALADNTYGYDMWGSVDAATDITASGGAITFNAGKIRQVIPVHDLAGEIITISVEDLSGGDLTVYTGYAGHLLDKSAVIPQGHGRVGVSIDVNTAATGSLMITLAPTAACTFKGPILLNKGQHIAPMAPRRKSIEEFLCDQFYQVVDALEKSMVASTGSATRITKPLRRKMYAVPVVTVSSALVGGLADGSHSIFALGNSSQLITEFGLQGTAADLAVWKWQANKTPSLTLG